MTSTEFPTPAQGFYVYRNGIKLATLPATVTSYPLPDPYLATDVVKVSAFATDPTTGVIAESTMTTAVQTQTPPTCTPGQFTSKFYLGTNPGGALSPVLTVCESTIDHDWMTSSPGQGVPSDGFSMLSDAVVQIPASGTLHISATSDDGVQVFVDNVIRIDKWIDQSATTYTADIPVVAGPHAIQVKYFENSGDAVLKLTYALLATPLDPCVTDPLIFTVTRWPAYSTGARRLDYSINKTANITLTMRATPWRATAVDTRGCTVTVTR